MMKWLKEVPCLDDPASTRLNHEETEPCHVSCAVRIFRMGVLKSLASHISSCASISQLLSDTLITHISVNFALVVLLMKHSLYCHLFIC